MGDLTNLTSWVPVSGISQLSQTVQVTEVSRGGLGQGISEISSMNNNARAISLDTHTDRNWIVLTNICVI